MTDLLNNPAVQSGAIPLLLGLVLAFALARTRFLAVVPWAGFIAVVALALDFSFEPLTLVRKLVLAGVASGVVALALDAARVKPVAGVRTALAVAAGAAALWMLWRVLGQKEGAQMWIAAAASALYAAVLMLSMLLVSADPPRAAATSTVVGLASGVFGLLGATASMAQMGIALGAASGAAVVAQMVLGRAPPGFYIVVPAAIACGLIGVGASLTGGVAWWALAPMPFVAVAARLVKPSDARSVWLDAVVSGLAALVPAALAVVLAWMGARAGTIG